MTAPRILLVLHQPDSTPGRVGEKLCERGYDLHRCCPSIGDPLPASLDDYHASVVFGGPQSANDDHLPGIRAELDWIDATALPAGKPLLGICLGAQLLARVLGARVGPHPEGRVEIGYHEILPTSRCENFLAEATTFYQWHAETFEIPSEALHLAHNAAFPGQAFRHGKASYGIEFHPEMTLDMINRWCTSESGAPKLLREGATPHAKQLQDHAQYAACTERWLDGFLDTLLGCERGALVEQAPDAAQTRARDPAFSSGPRVRNPRSEPDR